MKVLFRVVCMIAGLGLFLPMIWMFLDTWFTNAEYSSRQFWAAGALVVWGIIFMGAAADPHDAETCSKCLREGA